jgi:hypothetical protein
VKRREAFYPELVSDQTWECHSTYSGPAKPCVLCCGVAVQRTPREYARLLPALLGVFDLDECVRVIFCDAGRSFSCMPLIILDMQTVWSGGQSLVGSLGQP